MTASERRQWQFWVRLGGAIFAVLFLTVWEHVEALRLERRLKELQRETGRLKYENGRLDAQVRQWTSSSNLDVVARKDYGMAPLEAPRLIGMDLK